LAAVFAPGPCAIRRTAYSAAACLSGRTAEILHSTPLVLCLPAALWVPCFLFRSPPLQPLETCHAGEPPDTLTVRRRDCVSRV
jgi:hypothetical protein